MDESQIDPRFPSLTCNVTGVTFQVLNGDKTDWGEAATADALLRHLAGEGDRRAGD